MRLIIKLYKILTKPNKKLFNKQKYLFRYKKNKKMLYKKV